MPFQARAGVPETSNDTLEMERTYLFMANKLSKLDFKWILYDVGNSAFVLLTASILPIYFNSLATGQGLSETEYLTWWSYGTSIATVIVAIAGPIMGTLADFPKSTMSLS